jgi:hypothetical protein
MYKMLAINACEAYNSHTIAVAENEFMPLFFDSKRKLEEKESVHNKNDDPISALSEIHAMVSEIYNQQLLHLCNYKTVALVDNNYYLHHYYNKLCDYENLELTWYLNEFENLFRFIRRLRFYIQKFGEFKIQYLTDIASSQRHLSLKVEIQRGEQVCLQLQTQSQLLEKKLVNYIHLLANKDGTKPKHILDQTVEYFRQLDLFVEQPGNLPVSSASEAPCISPVFCIGIQDRHQSLLTNLNLLPASKRGSSSLLQRMK